MQQMLTNQKVVGIVAASSTGYVEEVFSHLNAGVAVVTLRSPDDAERMRLSGTTEEILPATGCGWLADVEYRPSYRDDIAQILFTSGTEGEAKAVLLSHRALASTTDRLISVMGMTSEIREYLGVPPYYSFGFGRCRAVSRVGGRIYVPEHGFDPLEIAEMLSSGQINAISTVPSLWRLILQNPELFENCADQVRWIEIGSQYMSGPEKASLRALFSNAVIVQHYGLTEASRSTFLRIDQVPENRLESVGSASEGVEIGLTHDGRLRIRGPHLASGLLIDGTHQPLTDEDGWFETGDRGRLDAGYVYFLGRADDIINCGGIKVSPDALEQQLRAHLGTAAGVCAARLNDAVRGDAILIAYLPEVDEPALRSAVDVSLGHLGLEPAGNVHYFACSDFPTTATGKVQRSVLASSFLENGESDSGGSPTQQLAQSEGHLSVNGERVDSDQIVELTALWESVLGVSQVSPNDSFFDLGGDSLSAINVAIKMEKLGIPKAVSRQIFQGKTIVEIVESSRAGGRRTPLASASQTVDIVRGVLALFVVASHWMPGVVERLPEMFARYNSLLSTFYSAGTPGFAIIFGVGVGFAYLPRYQRSPESVTTLTYRNALLLGGGILALALVRIAAGLTAGIDMSPVDFSNSFYGVLTYYLLAVLSIPLWLRILSGRASFWLSCLAFSLIMYGLHLAVVAWNPSPSTNPFVQTGILLITAKFNYFEMTAGVMFGVAAGDWFRRMILEDAPLAQLWQTGLLMMLAGFLISVEMGYVDLWLVWPKPMFAWTWIFYAGVVLIALRLVFPLSQIAEHDHPKTERLLRLLSVIGILAFPLFIGHELVIPFKDLLEALGVPAALTISIVLFFGAMAYLIVRLYRIYYADERS